MAVGGSATVHVDATPEEVYDVVADITRMPEWSPETYRAHWLGGATAAAPGVRFRGWNKAGPIRWFTDPVIDVADRGRELAFTTTLFGRGRFTTWRYRMTSAEGGGTLLEETWEEQIGLLDRVLPAARKQGLQRGMEQTLGRIKAAVESR